MKKRKVKSSYLDHFEREIASVGEEARGNLGDEDVIHIKNIKSLSRVSEILGRGLIYISLDPLTWSLGVALLGIHHQLETSEIGHAALHGAWDGLKGAEYFDSKNFHWNTPVNEEAWKTEHNLLHHRYTNIAGRDPDLSFGILRVTEHTKWMPYHLVQTAQFFWSAPFFIWMIASHASGLTDLLHPKNDDSYAPVLQDQRLKTFFNSFYQTIKKMLPYSLYEFVFWPILAGPFWWKILGGNLGADVLRNIYSSAIIYAGHFGEDLQYYDKNFKTHSRGEWYKSQIESAHNYTIPGFMSLLCGALDFQIEHHLFPRLPPNRLREISPKIESICKKYKISYKRTSLGKNLAAAMKRLGRLSFPNFTVPFFP
ncbi:MAG: fatty acid desaturase [Deltaproteobacteria bacterium]|nr:MAG: fatty acid desaturase [Deltaproteobacteria bacterium]